MGFGTQQTTRATFVNIVAGKLSVQSEEGAEGAVSRKNKNEKIVWEKHYPDLTGMLVGVECRENPALKANEYVLTIDDVGATYKVSIPCDSNYGDSFIIKLPNMKLQNIYTFTPYDFEDKVNKKQDGSPRRNIGISIKNIMGEKIAAYFSKETPNGRPQPEENMDKDDYKVYQIKVRKFYRSVVDQFIINNAKPNQPAESSFTPTSQQQGMGNPIVEDEGSDLPFVWLLICGLSMLIPMM